MMQSTSQKPVLSPVNGKPVMLNFDGAEMSADAGLTLLREVERRHDLAGLLSPCLTDLRDPGKTRHSLDDIIRFRIMMIAAGYEDGNDAGEPCRQEPRDDGDAGKENARRAKIVKPVPEKRQTRP